MLPSGGGARPRPREEELQAAARASGTREDLGSLRGARVKPGLRPAGRRPQPSGGPARRHAPFLTKLSWLAVLIFSVPLPNISIQRRSMLSSQGESVQSFFPFSSIGRTTVLLVGLLIPDSARPSANWDPI
jgi:hypothetical protein